MVGGGLDFCNLQTMVCREPARLGAAHHGWAALRKFGMLGPPEMLGSPNFAWTNSMHGQIPCNFHARNSLMPAPSQVPLCPPTTPHSSHNTMKKAERCAPARLMMVHSRLNST
eukprot:5260652-Prymnesium_polylepis.1